MGKIKRNFMTQKNNNKEHYDNYWNDCFVNYLSSSSGSRWCAYLINEILKEIPKSSIKSVADIGCGVGMKTAQMANYFDKAKVNGYDLSESGIKTAQRHHKQKNIHFTTEDITKAANIKKFDLITAFDVLEHIEDWQKLVKKLIKSNNKYIIFCAPVGRMRPYEFNIGHYRNFRINEIEIFMESQGYRTIKTFYAGFPFYSPIIRNLTNKFHKNYYDNLQTNMSFISKRIHDVWYFLFRYCSLKHVGDNFIGLFEKIENNGNEAEK